MNHCLFQNQKLFNKVVSQKRQVIERAFALLKGRFRRLKFLDMSRLDVLSFNIIASCVLHNICLEGIDDNIEEFVQEGYENYEEEDNDEENDQEYDKRHDLCAGEIKRNYLCLQIAGR